jgi:wyosine [tRNA(Phe)-imidazoG37] synthetase (radical SAM superfamily)
MPARKKSFTYGPVPSRRLGYSLGVDIIPPKTCSFDCVYCQLGRTARRSGRRKRFFPCRDILAQVKEALARSRRIDHITFSGSGEPTLNLEIGKLIRKIKNITSIPVVVLTNSSLLVRKAVRRALRAADIVVPSLDAATAASFRRVNRPRSTLKISDIIRGLTEFRREFGGQIWLEIMLVKGINDSPADSEALRKAITRIRPDKVQLNTVVRPPAEPWAKPLSRAALEKIKKRLGGRAEVVASLRKKPPLQAAAEPKTAVLNMVARRPMTLQDMAASLGGAEREIRPHLAALLRRKIIVPRPHRGTVYYELGKPRRRGEGDRVSRGKLE